MYLDAIDQLHTRTVPMNTETENESQPQSCEESLEHSIEQLVEGETRLYGLSDEGVIFETDYINPDDAQRAFTVLWKNRDASGFLKSHKGDQIVGIRY